MTPPMASRIPVTVLKYQSSAYIYNDNTSDFHWGENQLHNQQQQWQYWEPSENRIQGIFLGEEEDKVEQGYQNLASVSNIFPPSLSSSWSTPTASWPTSHSYIRPEIYSPNTASLSSSAGTHQSFSSHHSTATMLPGSPTYSSNNYHSLHEKTTGMLRASTATYSSFHEPKNSYVSPSLPRTTFYSSPLEQETTGMFVATTSNTPAFVPQIYAASRFPTSTTTTMTRPHSSMAEQSYDTTTSDGSMFYASRLFQPEVRNNAAERWHQRQQRLTSSAVERQERMLTMNAFDHIRYL
ncbi:hypothetical protein IV203_029003 [Nitzschia inconspicua]|uniref:Uncharacterized protein n=1 Tax=Nitzschia inconspicua TaxID=303405 RepID=A0A9K3LQX6_9STRA|nr:hypothetical protein IV203_029003 [Nitzschia inconspicua]